MSPENKEAFTSPDTQRPRSLRIPANLSLQLEGVTKHGKPFKITAQTVKVSYLGATVIADVALQPGSYLKVKQPFGSSLDAQVNSIWISEDDGSQMAGLRLLGAYGWFTE